MPQMQIKISSFLKVPRRKTIRKGQLYQHDDGHGRISQRTRSGERLAECIGDFLYDDLDHNVVTDIENNADDISCVNLVDKHNDDTCDVYDGV
jgi:hypothetical protein